MNRLNKLVISFVLPFLCLLVSVSYATEFTIEGIPYSPYTDTVINDRTTLPNTIVAGDYTFKQAFELWEGVTGDNNSLVAYNSFLQACTDKGYTVFGGITGSSKKLIIVDGNADIGASGGSFYYALSAGQNYYYIDKNSYYKTVQVCQYTANSDGYRSGSSVGFNSTVEYLGTNKHVKTISVSNNMAFWDGTYAYDKPPICLPNSSDSSSDTPSLPSNSEIAQAVQAFYNSDYYKNNKDFSDFMVLYSYKTGYFSFVGHNFGIDLGQVIVPPNYEYDGYSYNQDWWKFFLRNLSSQIASKLWNKYYWLYTSNDFGETITYDGKGAIGDLIDIHFSTSSTIVYSTTDYPVVKIETDENGVLTPVEGTIPGNQYTYDENLDPTTNEYNPLENFIPTNPSQNILGNVDFDEINKVFEENKNILNIEGASWLFAANNKLVGYFTGFLSFLIVLILISRMLGG